MAAWGYNLFGQLGDNTTTQRNVPVAVNTGTGFSALRQDGGGHRGGRLHSLALCSDGTVAAWGCNGSGQLGDNTTTNRLRAGGGEHRPGRSALYGKTVVAIAAG